MEEKYPDVRETGKTTVEQCQLVMTRMLHIFHDMCEKHNIVYNLSYGTLLGAYRHKGFIPWDMDVDVIIKIEDYERLKKALIEEIPPDMFFQDGDTDSLYPSWATPKLRDRYSNYYEWGNNNPECKWHNGLQLDIFCFYEKDGICIVKNDPYRPNSKDELCTGDAYLEFAGKKLRVPKNTLKCLLDQYGTVDLPPEKDWIAHEGLASPFIPCKHPASNLGNYPKIQK